MCCYWLRVRRLIINLIAHFREFWILKNLKIYESFVAARNEMISGSIEAGLIGKRILIYFNSFNCVLGLHRKTPQKITWDSINYLTNIDSDSLKWFLAIWFLELRKGLPYSLKFWTPSSFGPFKFGTLKFCAVTSQAELFFSLFLKYSSILNLDVFYKK